ncbi:UTP--glucose-1-phosphate uridylyltransferase [Halobellus salinus]|uniref:UTP--glucose-1-phosphate uridylyltransferase n=1 Tax=Halobellus salinus TaxID=931585 RepID=A0A830E601_9EURY|nr:UTP--glucose-1-phosphate uridylyltransferase GalU [Halobellus salinus]GGI95837.1 UTP--glucose-1-phosphate uridylyltransferase [Halobellus salinus]SMP12570.1 UDP-glucose pyrophosphorylase [Halobellus salinus]
MDVTKAVIPAAGFGTRFLPVTKAQPKEMMPVLDKPTIQYVVEEAVEAGIDDILIITGRGKQAIERHFDKSYELEEALKADAKHDRLDRVQDIADLADIHYVRQKERDGLGDAVQYAEKHVGDDPFALLLGDTIIESDTPCTANLINAAETHETSVLSLERVPWADVPSYGVADVGDVESSGGSFPVTDFVEKPPREEAPSNLAITGRYVLTSEIFDALDRTEMGVGGELQLTDAIRKLDGVRGVELDGDRYDIGNIPSWLQANIEMALTHDDGEMNDAVKNILEAQFS